MYSQNLSVFFFARKIPEIQGTGAKQGKEAGRREHQCAPSGRKGRGEP